MLRKKNIFATLRYLYKKVKNFLSKAQSKELLTFLFFLCLSFLFWILQSMNEEADATYRIPIRYQNIPENIIFTNEPPTQLTLRIRDKGISLLNYSFGKAFKPIPIDVASYLNKKNVALIKDDQLRMLLRKQLNVSSTILSISPDTLVIHYSQQQEKILPVKLIADISSGAQYQIGQKVQVEPDSIRVFAPREVLDTLKSVPTSFIRLSGLSDTVTHQIALKPIKNTKFIPSSVKITVPVEEYTEKILTIPLSVVGLPSNLALRTFPSTVKLSCFVVLRNFKDITPDQFTAVVDYKNILELRSNKIPVEILRAPENVTNVRCNPDSVEFIIEEKE